MSSLCWNFGLPVELGKPCHLQHFSPRRRKLHKVEEDLCNLKNQTLQSCNSGKCFIRMDRNLCTYHLLSFFTYWFTAWLLSFVHCFDVAGKPRFVLGHISVDTSARIFAELVEKKVHIILSKLFCTI
jgi:hypothetical protein